MKPKKPESSPTIKKLNHGRTKALVETSFLTLIKYFFVHLHPLQYNYYNSLFFFPPLFLSHFSFLTFPFSLFVSHFLFLTFLCHFPLFTFPELQCLASGSTALPPCSGFSLFFVSFGSFVIPVPKVQMINVSIIAKDCKNFLFYPKLSLPNKVCQNVTAAVGLLQKRQQLFCDNI